MRYLCVLALASCCLFSVASAQTPAAFWNDGGTRSYSATFDGTFWNGERRKASYVFTFDGAPGAWHIAQNPTSPDLGSKSEQDVAAFDPNGAIATKHIAPQTIEPFSVLNQIVTAFAGAKLHDVKTVTVPLGVGNDQSVRIPLRVEVVAVQGDTVTLQAAGSTHDSATYGQYTVAIVPELRISVRLGAGKVTSAIFAASDYIDAGSQSQTLNWSWKIDQK